MLTLLGPFPYCGWPQLLLLLWLLVSVVSPYLGPPLGGTNILGRSGAGPADLVVRRGEPLARNWASATRGALTAAAAARNPAQSCLATLFFFGPAGTPTVDVVGVSRGPVTLVGAVLVLSMLEAPMLAVSRWSLPMLAVPRPSPGSTLGSSLVANSGETRMGLPSLPWLSVPLLLPKLLPMPLPSPSSGVLYAPSLEVGEVLAAAVNGTFSVPSWDRILLLLRRVGRRPPGGAVVLLSLLPWTDVTERAGLWLSSLLV